MPETLLSSALVVDTSRAIVRRKKSKWRKLNIEELRKINIIKVAEALNMELVKTGPDSLAWVSPSCRRGEWTSLTIFTGTNNWVRFSGVEQGGVSKGSVIDLVMHIQECDLPSALHFLSNLSL